jgi:hypothetical protein
MRREETYLLREEIIDTRESDSMQIIRIFGRSGVDLLSRRFVIQAEDTAYASKTAPIDDMMKAIVREQMLYGSCVDETGTLDNTRAWPSGEFLVDQDQSFGPSTTKTFQDRNVLDVLKELKDASFALHDQAVTNRKIYFDMVETQIAGTNRFGWTFRTFADLRGSDRTYAVEFSLENENLKTPGYVKSHMDEINAVYVKNGTTVQEVLDSNRVASSRWNRCEYTRFGYYEASAAGLTTIGNSELGAGIPREQLTAIFLNVPETGHSPRSLYGIDWDLGDLLPVNYAGLQFNAEVMIVYVSLNDQGKENITGRNKVGE